MYNVAITLCATISTVHLQEFLHLAKSKLFPLTNKSTPSSAPIPANHLLLSVSMCLTTLRASYKCRRRVFVLLWLAMSLSMILRLVHVIAYVRIPSFLKLDNISSVYAPHFVDAFIRRWTCELFQQHCYE